MHRLDNELKSSKNSAWFTPTLVSRFPNSYLLAAIGLDDQASALAFESDPQNCRKTGAGGVQTFLRKIGLPADRISNNQTWGKYFFWLGTGKPSAPPREAANSQLPAQVSKTPPAATVATVSQFTEDGSRSSVVEPNVRRRKFEGVESVKVFLPSQKSAPWQPDDPAKWLAGRLATASMGKGMSSAILSNEFRAPSTSGGDGTSWIRVTRPKKDKPAQPDLSLSRNK